MCAKTVFCCRQSRNVAGATEKRPNFWQDLVHAHERVRVAGRRSGRSSTPLTTLKMALLAPMPSASVRMATTVKPGVLRQLTERVARVAQDVSKH